ncbi:DoxX family protein [Mycolicibacterium stellerae]|uniref:DoxX family protein n=1 Tax=Mycolicibacterium stellerae TaxID=2358193 RepID=UPI000F0B11BD|nr:DoxX family protein [Mycolicibacterium stellerae]
MSPFDVGVLLLRVVLGLTMAGHGYNKFIGPGGLKGTAGWFDSLGMKPGMFHARVAATAEMSAGMGIAVGLLTPISAAGFVALMLVAAWTVHRHNGFFIVKDGWEYNLVLATFAVGIAAIGPGRLSLDYVVFHEAAFSEALQGWWGLVISTALGLAGGIGQLVVFWRPPAQTQA